MFDKRRSLKLKYLYIVMMLIDIKSDRFLWGGSDMGRKNGQNCTTIQLSYEDLFSEIPTHYCSDPLGFYCFFFAYLIRLSGWPSRWPSGPFPIECPAV